MLDLVFLAALLVVAIVPPVLAFLAWRQSRRVESKRWRRTLPLLTLISWAALIAMFAVGMTSGLPRWALTHLADCFLLLSLTVVVGAFFASAGKAKMFVAGVMLLVSWVWAEQQQANYGDGSALSVLISRAADKMGRPPDQSVFLTLRRIENYQRRGMNDAALDVGLAWLERNPHGGVFGSVPVAAAWSYIAKARQDPARANEYVHKALVLRDKAVPAAFEGKYTDINALDVMTQISLSAGYLSPERRCVQMANAVKFMERRAEVLTYLSTSGVKEQHSSTARNESLAAMWRDAADQTNAATADLRAQLKTLSCAQ